MGACCSSKPAKKLVKLEKPGPVLDGQEDESISSFEKKLETQMTIDDKKLEKVPSLSKKFMKDSTLMKKRKESRKLSGPSTASSLKKISIEVSSEPVKSKRRATWHKTTTKA